MSIAAPAVQLDEILSTREFSNSVWVSPEEKLVVRSAAISKSNTQLTFQIRQPAPQAILENCPKLELVLEFELAKSAADGAAGAALDGNWPVVSDAADDTCYGAMPEGFPFQTKCVKTLSCTQNGATTTYRPSETFKGYLQANTTRKFMERNGVAPWNDYHNQYAINVGTGYAANAKGIKVTSRAEGIQHEIFRRQAIGEDQEGYTAQGASNKLRVFYYSEPLFWGVYNGIGKSDSFPMWSGEFAKSPSLLHQDSTSIDMALVDGWERNMCPLISATGTALMVKSCKIVEANMVFDFWSPPPRYVASALSMSASYACSLKTLRYEIDSSDGTTMAPRATTIFKISNSSFPSMPNCFMFKVMPNYQHKMNKIGATAAHQAISHASKMDSCPAIVDMRLQINTSSNCFPQVGNVDTTQANIHNFRFSARQLYKYYLKNTSYDESLYDFEAWFKHGCTVILTSADLNGVLNSPSIIGLTSVTAQVTVYNTLPYSIYVGNGQPAGSNVAAMATDQKLEKFTCSVVGYYSNSYISFDSKSAQVGQQQMSAAFGSGLRLA